MNFEDKGRVLAYLKNDDEKDRKKWEKLYLTDKPTDVRGGVFRDVKLKDKPNSNPYLIRTLSVALLI